MDPVLSACVTMFALNDRFFGKALDGLSLEEAWKHPADANPIYWIAGHVAVYRASLASRLGVGPEPSWAHLFKIKTQPDPAAAGPTLSEICRTFSEAKELVVARFASLTDAELSAEAPVKLPIPDPTVRGMIVFSAYHETHHVGQIAYVKKWLGYAGVVDGQ